jgi:hypothetical protein
MVRRNGPRKRGKNCDGPQCVWTEIGNFDSEDLKKHYYQVLDDNIKMLEGNNWTNLLHPIGVRSRNKDKMPGNVLL